MAVSDLWKGYNGGEQMPLPGYAVLLGAYGAGFAGLALGLSRKGKHAPSRFAPAALVLGGIATHKLTRIATRDWVTAPLRAPFTEFKQAKSGGEVTEKSRGGPFRRAVGDLLTCAYCSGPWIAGAIIAGFVAAPRATRLLTGLFSMVALSDFLHRAYEGGGARVDLLKART